ncbi:MAG TPA: hypothetical protein VK633_11055 [Verrucomicrobiae bacterium]|nr:hypothetical protein [Verrucomicrobiae bacterium]
MPSPTKNKILLAGAVIALAAVAAVGALTYALSGDPEIEFGQNPNSVEAHEANRKLKLFNEAHAAKRQGFVRFSEIEINSFLDSRYRSSTNNVRTNSPVRVVKAGVLLNSTNLNFITWLKAPVFGITLPFVWQRTVSPHKETNGWTFAVQDMRLGTVRIPENLWERVEHFLGGSDGTFQERMTWLSNLPTVSLARNELNHAPEIRLYTYVPPNKSLPFSTVEKPKHASTAATRSLTAGNSL